MQAKRKEVHDVVRQIASALHCMYDDKIGYERILVNRRIVSLERARARRFRTE